MIELSLTMAPNGRRRTLGALDSQLTESQSNKYIYGYHKRVDGDGPPATDSGPPSKSPVPPSIPPLQPRPKPPQEKGGTQPFVRPLVGSHFSGSESLNGYGKLKFVFYGQGRV